MTKAIVDLAGLTKLRRIVGKSVPIVSLAMAEGIGRDSDKEVPVDTGKLKRSKRVEGLSDGSARVRYGDSDVDYAAAVHFKTGINYKRGKRLFLRDPAMRKPAREKDAADSMKRELAKV